MQRPEGMNGSPFGDNGDIEDQLKKLRDQFDKNNGGSGDVAPLRGGQARLGVNVGDVDESDEIGVFFEFGDEVSFGDLLVEEIVKELYVRIVDGPGDFETFG